MAGRNNQLSRYGAITKVLPYLGPQGSVFIVASPTSVYLAALMDSFPTDNGGVPRVFTSITAASAATSTGRGDVIVVAPGYAEIVTAAAGIQLSSAGVTIVGMGNGSQRPTISFTTSTAADINFDAAGVVFENFIFDLTGIDALVAPLDVNALGCGLRKCKVITASASGQATLGLVADANAGDMVLEDCVFVGTTDAGTTAAVQVTGGDSIAIRRNTFIGAYTSGVGAISNITTACTNLMLEDNRIWNGTAGSTKAITLVAGTTGIASGNKMVIGSGTAPITGAGLAMVQNFSAPAVGAGQTNTVA